MPTCEVASASLSEIWWHQSEPVDSLRTMRDSGDGARPSHNLLCAGNLVAKPDVSSLQAIVPLSTTYAQAPPWFVVGEGSPAAPRSCALRLSGPERDMGYATCEPIRGGL